MIFAVSSQEARSSRTQRELDGKQYFRTDYFTGHLPGCTETPQAFIVEKGPGVTSRPHFHRTDEFQLFIRGTGKLGKFDLAPIAIHYAAAYTPYGPLVAGPEGFTYFTLRVQHDTGAYYMPESRSALKRAAKKFLIAEARVAAGDELRRQGKCAPDTLIEEDDEGLACWSMTIAPGAKMRSTDPSGSGGQFLVVVAGSIRHEERILDKWSCLFLPRQNDATELEATDLGAQVLVMQYPHRLET